MTDELERRERLRLAETVERLEQPVAEQVTELFLQRHPEWLIRFGERARQHGLEDAAFHVKFLAGSLHSGSPDSFREYVAWTAGVLESRGMDRGYLAENLEQVKWALSARLQENDARLALDYLDAGISRPSEPAATYTPSGGRSARLARTRDLFTQAVVMGERTAATNIIREALREGVPAQVLYVEVLQEAMYSVGRRWESAELTVGQEHLATAIVQYILVDLYAHLPQPERRCGNMVMTGTKGEHHQVGPMMVADVLEADGWNMRYLGSNLPLTDIARVVEEHKADVLGISTTMLFNIPRVRELIDKCRRLSVGSKLRIIVGGRAFRTSPNLYEEVGADAFANDLHDARNIVGEWCKP